jgi:predicted HicB family RNase H-like nuclease
VLDMARIHYEVPDDLHRKAKAAAALQGITLKEFVVTALEQAVKQSGTRRGR